MLRSLIAVIPLIIGAAPLLPPFQQASALTVTTDDATADDNVTATDGTNIRVRVLRPTTGGPYPAIIIKGGTGANRCADMDFVSRNYLASLGYIVIGMTGRGMPGKAEAGSCTGANQADDITDQINDSGSDWYGPNDIQDVKDVVTWASGKSYVDSTKIGFIGHSHDAGLAYLLAAADSRIDAIVPVSGLTMGMKGDNVAAVNDHSGAVPVLQANGFNTWGLGVGLNYDGATTTNMNLWWRSKFLGTSPAGSVTTWQNDRTVVDDNNSVDKAHLLTTPTFITHGWYDANISPENAIQAFNKLPVNNKYLYVGACSGHSSPCLTNNATWLRNKVVDFLAKYLKGSAVSLGGPLFYAVPPAEERRSGSGPYDSWTVNSSSNTSWPPTSSTLDLFLRTGGNLGSVPTTTEAVDTLSNPNQISAFDESCLLQEIGKLKDGSGGGPNYLPQFGAGETQTYTTAAFAGNTTLVGFDADIYLKSTTPRMQLMAELIEVDPSKAAGLQEVSMVTGLQNVLIPTGATTAGTTLRFKFKPISTSYTVKAGNKLRLKISSHFKWFYAAEPYPGTYSIVHTSAQPSKLTIRYL